MFCIPKILKNESNSQLMAVVILIKTGFFVSQRYWKMKAIHNAISDDERNGNVVLYPKDTEKWKQFTTRIARPLHLEQLFCIPKILKNESNSQRIKKNENKIWSCFVSQRYWKMKAIHNIITYNYISFSVVLYPKDTEKWKQFTTTAAFSAFSIVLFCIPKILKNEI